MIVLRRLFYVDWCGLGKILNFSNLYLLRRIHRQTWSADVRFWSRNILVWGNIIHGVVQYGCICHLMCRLCAVCLSTQRESNKKNTQSSMKNHLPRGNVTRACWGASAMACYTGGSTRTPHVSMRQANFAFARPLILKGKKGCSWSVWSINTLVA